ncbi:MAG: FAD-dependent oxidoreductase, partial [Winogradskyella sp.]|nr:FAD-dependent oxidoreductase [Winogradskyella sp.]
TTYRRMAQDTVDKIIALGKLPYRDCQTHNLQIHGANGAFKTSNHLRYYGTDQDGIEKIKEEDPNLAMLLHARLEFTKVEVIWAVRYEMARTIEDVLARRVRILFLDAKAAIEIAPEVGELMRKELNETLEWRRQQIEEFKQLAAQYVLT